MEGCTRRIRGNESEWKFNVRISGVGQVHVCPCGLLSGMEEKIIEGEDTSDLSLCWMG